MPSTKNHRHNTRNSSGLFLAKNVSTKSLLLDDANVCNHLDSILDNTALATVSDNAGDTDYSDNESSGSEEEWKSIPKPLTWDEKRVVKNLHNQRKRVDALRKQSMKAAEQELDGQIDKNGGAKDKTGKKRGPYKIGGDSERTARRKRQKLRAEDEAGGFKASDTEMEQKLRSITARGKGMKQSKLTDLFLQNYTKIPDSDVISVSSGSELEPEVRVDNIAQVSSVQREEEEETSSDKESNNEVVEDVRDHTVKEAAEIADWVENALDDAVSKEPPALEALAWESLKKARKSHDYRSEVLFASLTDFYRWIP
jgi:hypothetical protein